LRAYRIGESEGWRAANWHHAYEQGSDDYDDNFPDDVDSKRVDFSQQDVWDYRRGHEDGWNRFMREDRPE